MDSQTITSKSGAVYTVPVSVLFYVRIAQYHSCSWRLMQDDTLEIHVLWPPEGQAGDIKAE